MLAAVILLLISVSVASVQHAQAITQFYFGLPNNFNLTKHTTFSAEYYDDDGEATSFIWNYSGIPFEFSVDADILPYKERHNQIVSVLPEAENLHTTKYDYRFAISDNLTIGENMRLCVDSIEYHLCEWPQPVDRFGRVLADLSGPANDVRITKFQHPQQLQKTQFYFWLPGENAEYLLPGTILSARTDNSTYSWTYNGSTFIHSGDGLPTDSDDSSAQLDCCEVNDWLFAIESTGSDAIGDRLWMRVDIDPAVNGDNCILTAIDESCVALAMFNTEIETLDTDGS